jgi:hypothetical protein
MTQMHKRGVLAAVICSDPFRTLGTTQARVLGVPALPLVMIAHPLGGLSIEQVEGRALVAIPQVIKLIKDNLS